MTDFSESDLCRRMADKLGSKWITFTETKSGSTWYGASMRFDLVAIRKSWSKPCIRIYEAKANRRTFLNDQKWPEYLEYCNEFYWLCPTGLIDKEEVDPRCGLITVNPKSDGVFTRKKAIFRDVDPISRSNMLMYLFMWRLNIEETDVPRSEKVAQIRKEIEENKMLGREYAIHVSMVLREAERHYIDIKHDIAHRERSLKSFEDWCKGIGLDTWRVKNAIRKDRLIKLLECPFPQQLRNQLPGLVRSMKNTTSEIEILLEILQEGDDGNASTT